MANRREATIRRIWGARGIVVWAPTNEVFVADGYGNRRVVVYDAETGAYKRHWGAYGNKPDDAAPRTRVYDGAGSPQFNLVHGIRISNDGLVYVGDRVNNRVQVFKLDGTFVKEGYIERKTSGAKAPRSMSRSHPISAALLLRSGRHEQENPDRRSPDARDPGIRRRPWRPRRAGFLPHPQHRDGFEGQHLYGRSQCRASGAALRV